MKPALKAHQYVCRIFEENRASTTAGVGFVIDDRHIVTCAHVVNTALGRDERAQVPPSRASRILVDFPMSSVTPEASVRTFTVVPTAWKPPGSAPGSFVPEFAGLELAAGEELPPEIGFAPLVNHKWVIPDGSQSTRMALYGYPSGRPSTWSRGRFAGMVDHGMLQFEGDSAVNPQAGFSGSPLIVEGNNDGPDYAVGMLAFAGGGTDRDACCVSVMDIWKFWPQLRAAMIRTLIARLWSRYLKKESAWAGPRFQVAPSFDLTARQTIAARHKLQADEEVIGLYVSSPFLSSFRPVGMSIAITTLGVSIRPEGVFAKPCYISYKQMPDYSVTRERDTVYGSQATTSTWFLKIRDGNGRTIFSVPGDMHYELFSKIHDLMRGQETR